MWYKLVVASVAAAGAAGHVDKGSAGQEVVNAPRLHRAWVVVSHVQEQSVGNARDQGPRWRLHESADGLSAITVNQTTLFVRVPRRHGLC
jgi:hypothetical protein